LGYTLRMRTEMVFEMLVFPSLNHLIQLIAWENFIILEHARDCHKCDMVISEEDYHKYFKWQHCSNDCVQLGGNHLEGDKFSMHDF
jgi:hypothetical protein